MILVEVTSSKIPIPLTSISVKGGSKSFDGSIVPLTEKKLMMVSMNLIWVESRALLIGIPHKARFAVLMCIPNMLRMNLPKKLIVIPFKNSTFLLRKMPKRLQSLVGYVTG